MGDAEADAMGRKAEAWKSYTSGAYMEMLINKLPLMAAQVRGRVFDAVPLAFLIAQSLNPGLFVCFCKSLPLS